jgi:anthranilate synthase component 1
MRRPFVGDAFAAFRLLSARSRTPINFLLRFPGFALLGTPPSPFLRLSGGFLVSEVGAGTRPVTGDADADRRAAEDLRSDQKELLEHRQLIEQAAAELHAIVGETAVEVPIMMELRKFAHVMHLMSQLRAPLPEGISAIHALQAAFPPTPVVGVPKPVAWQAVADIERSHRGPYGGVFGLVGFDGTMNSAIIERSIWIASGMAHLRVGAGITAGSVPEREFAECLQKARGLKDAIDTAATGETLG